MANQLKTIDICCGLGGISLAAKELNIQPVLGVDICQNALKTYKNNIFQTDILNADITENNFSEKIVSVMEEKEIDREDMFIVSGPPCQGFSVAGKRQVDDPRNSIIVKVASLIARIKPKAAIIENVAAINHPRYQDILGNINNILERAGYYVCCIELNAADFGVSQRRVRRMFLVTKSKVSEEQYSGYFITRHRNAPVIREAFAGLPKARVRPDKYHDGLLNRGFYNHFAMQHSKKVMKKIADIEPGKGPLSYRKLDPEGYAPTLICGHRAPPAHYAADRSITTREAARIQGFPDEFRIFGPFGNQLQQVANAVPPKLAKVALKALVHFAG